LVKPALRVSSSVRATSTIASADSECGSESTSGTPLVRSFAEARVERHAAEQLDAELGREALAATRAEDVGGHVLDDTRQLHSGLERHRGGSARHLLRERLRRRDDDGLGARQHLAERDRDVARSRRHVDDEHVELAPVHVLQELLERRCSIGPRHISGSLSSRKNPIDISFRSCLTGGIISRSTSTASG
jgi:hypothetical protein